MRKTKNRIAIACVVALLGVVGLETLVQAHTFDVASDTNIKYQKYDNKPNRFKGRITSQKKRCKRNRSVSVYKVQDGQDKLMGTDISRDGGYWSVKEPNPSGRFYAVVAAKKRTKPHHSHHCRRGESGKIDVE